MSFLYSYDYYWSIVFDIIILKQKEEEEYSYRNDLSHEEMHALVESASMKQNTTRIELFSRDFAFPYLDR